MAIGISSLWSCTAKAQISALEAKPKHVIVIGFDGLSPAGLENATTPNFHKIMQEGASTLHARAVLPSSSSTNWASMIMGAGPEQHGITSNSWEKNNFVLPAVTQSEDFLFPTIFHLIDKQIPNAEIGAIYHWDGFGRLFEKSAVDYDVNPKTEDETAKVANAYISDKKPTFTFIHFDHNDHAGHEYGHGSPEYYKSVEKADELLGAVMEVIKKSGMENETLVIISSDHGGVAMGHGGESLEEVEIPFILWGKMIKKNFKIIDPVYQYDNAATVAFALGLRTPKAWIGKPVKNAFVGFSEMDDYPLTERLKEPIMFPKAVYNKKAGGLFDVVAEISIENPNQDGKIFFTVDGTMPTKFSKAYTTPFNTNQNTVVKSAIFKNGKISSMVSEAYYRVKSKKLLAPVTYELFYLDNLSSIPSLKSRIPDSKGSCFEITTDGLKEEIKRNTAIRFRTQIRIEKAGSYTFYTRSDDGSKLWVNAVEVVDNDGDHGVRVKDGSIVLKEGMHPMEIVYFNAGGGGWLDVFYESKDIPKQIIPTTVLNAQ